MASSEKIPVAAKLPTVPSAMFRIDEKAHRTLFVFGGGVFISDVRIIQSSF